MLMAAAVGAALLWIPICGVAGEMLAVSLTIWRLNHRDHVPPSKCLRPFVTFIISVSIGIFAVYQRVPKMGLRISLPACMLTIAISIGTMVLLFPKLYRDCMSIVGRRIRRMGIAAVPVYK
jgi:hypothetical protein